MKNLKVLLITALVSLAIVSYADNKPKNVKSITKISIEQVFTVPGLAAAVFSQVNSSFLKYEKQQTYHAVVRLHGRTYYVSGSRTAWFTFFNMKPVKAQAIWWD